MLKKKKKIAAATKQKPKQIDISMGESVMSGGFELHASDWFQEWVLVNDLFWVIQSFETLIPICEWASFLG